MTTKQKIIDAFERAKGEIFELYVPHVRKKERESCFDIENTLARDIAQNLYGKYIDMAIEQVREHGAIAQNLRSIFKISMRNTPQDGGLGHGRMEEYHRRFVAKVAPILDVTPVVP